EQGSGLDFFNYEQIVSLEDGLGIALDLGTTTLAACLVDLKSGKILSKTSSLNPQAAYGADVLTRIKACTEGKLTILHSLIIEETNEIIDKLSCNKQISTLVVCANTTMLHIFANENPKTIGSYPFTPVFKDAREYFGRDLNINAKKVRLLPSASAYIGSDITAGITALNLNNLDGVNLLIDVGTNGEIVLTKKGEVFATSTAAGPAFEGACIECGIGGVEGAISKVIIKDNNIQFSVIGNIEPQGICGSGLIDLISLLLSEGLIDESGTFDECANSPLISNLKGDKFYLTDDIYLSQKDVRQYQLAKAAICAGIEALLIECNIDKSEVENAYIAGGLGYYMNVENAFKTEVLPNWLKGKTRTVGNSGLAGAVYCMLSDKKFDEIVKIAKNTKIIELSFSKIFQELYVENMMFKSN
ncbi:MAG: DUF4445 domain-containing protein, partial [Clostridia bacterium]|nr:DUF4445 domain-containing protein [Clostridia bacterium]